MRDEFETSLVRIPPEVNFLPIGHAAHRVMNALFRFANKAWELTVSRAVLMRFIPDPDPRNLSRAMRELIDKGYVKRMRNEDVKTGADKKNSYKIILPSLIFLRKSVSLDKSVHPCVTSTHPRASKSTQKAVPNRYELKEENLKSRHEPTRSHARQTSKTTSYDNGDARSLLNHFKTLFQKSRGRVMVEKPYHLGILGRLVGTHGYPCATAICETWFSPGSWSAFAGKSGFSIEAFDRCVEQISDSTKCQELKRKYVNYGG